VIIGWAGHQAAEAGTRSLHFPPSIPALAPIHTSLRSGLWSDCKQNMLVESIMRTEVAQHYTSHTPSGQPALYTCPSGVVHWVSPWGSLSTVYVKGAWACLQDTDTDTQTMCDNKWQWWYVISSTCITHTITIGSCTQYWQRSIFAHNVEVECTMHMWRNCQEEITSRWARELMMFSARFCSSNCSRR